MDRRGKIERANWGPPWKPFDVEGYRKGGGMVKRDWVKRIELHEQVPGCEEHCIEVVPAADYDALMDECTGSHEAQWRVFEGTARR